MVSGGFMIIVVPLSVISLFVYLLCPQALQKASQVIAEIRETHLWWGVNRGSWTWFLLIVSEHEVWISNHNNALFWSLLKGLQATWKKCKLMVYLKCSVLSRMCDNALLPLVTAVATHGFWRIECSKGTVSLLPPLALHSGNLSSSRLYKESKTFIWNCFI